MRNPTSAAPDPATWEVEIVVEGRRLPGDLAVPPGAGGVVVFAHGSGSSRLSPRNRAVAAALQRQGFATLLFDLLDAGESADRARVFDVALLARRLDGALVWCENRRELEGLPLGLFGASTGAAAALVVAASRGRDVAAVVSRGGRPDLAAEVLGQVTSPTMLVVGGADDVVLELNRGAAAALRCRHELEVVPGATHLFEEPGALEQVVRLAGAWFASAFAAARRSARNGEPEGSPVPLLREGGGEEP